MIDYLTPAFHWQLILPEIALLIVASIVLLGASRPVWLTVSPVLTFAGLGAALGLAISQWNNGGTGFHNMVFIDNFAVAFRVLSIVTSLFAVLMSYRYLRVKGIDKPEFYGLLLIATIGMLVMASSADLIVIFLGLEIMSIPLYVMAGFARRSLESNEAGIKYFIMGAFASAFLLMGIAAVFGAAGSSDIRVIAASAGDIMWGGERGWYLILGAALILIGFGFKIGAVPFHTWIPDVYQGAPTPVTAFFSVGPKAAGFAVLLRLFTSGYAELELFSTTFWILAVLTMTLGNVLALRQSNVKRMLAYSSIAHAGYVLVAVTVGGEAGIASAFFYLVAYAMFNLGAFAVLVALESRTGARAEFSELAGMSVSQPYLAAALALFMFGLSGFPPLVGFFGKFYLFSAAVDSGFIWLAVIGVLNSFVSVYYYLRVIKCSYFDKAEERFAPLTLNPSLMVVLVVTALGTIGLGLFPQHLLSFSQRAIIALM